MSDVVKQIIEKAVKDEDFRKLLFDKPDKALADYDLSQEDRDLLSNLNKDNFDDFAGDLGDRTTKGFMPGTG